jgi:hypothetical protein
MEEETIKIKISKIGKCNTKFKLKNLHIFFFKNQNYTLTLPVKWEVCDTSTFLRLFEAKGQSVYIV